MDEAAAFIIAVFAIFIGVPCCFFTIKHLVLMAWTITTSVFYIIVLVIPFVWAMIKIKRRLER